MDRLNQIRGEAGSSRDLTLDTTSPPSEAFMTANDSSSKYFSLSEVDSTFSISPSKDSTVADSERTVTVNSELISDLSPIPKKCDLDNYKIGKQIEAANILSGGVNIFDDNENSYDGDELVIDDNVVIEDDKSNEIKSESTDLPLEKNMNLEPLMLEDAETPSKDTEVVLQIDGKNVDAIDIGNGLYLYRKAGQEELAAVQIIDDDQQQPSFKFLKVRENIEGNLEVYEEIEIEIPKEVPVKEKNQLENISHVPIKDISKVMTEPTNKIPEKIKTPINEAIVTSDLGSESDTQSESKTELNLNGKMMKFTESRKSPLIGTYTPMTYHSTPNKEGIPLTKTMVDQQLHPSRHSDNVKKTIEVTTDSCRQKLLETPTKNNKDNEPLIIPEEALDHDERELESENELPAISSKNDILSKSVHTPDIAVCESTTLDKVETKLIIDDTSIDTKVINHSKLDIENKEVVIENNIDPPSQELDKLVALQDDKICQNSATNSTIGQNDKPLEVKAPVENMQENKLKNDHESPMDVISEIIHNENINGDLVKDVKNIDDDKILPFQKLFHIYQDTVDGSKNKEALEEAINLNQESCVEKIENENVKHKTVNKKLPENVDANEIGNDTEKYVGKTSDVIGEIENITTEKEKNANVEDKKPNMVKDDKTNTSSIENSTIDLNVLTNINEKEHFKCVEINSVAKDDTNELVEIDPLKEESLQKNQNSEISNDQNQDKDKKNKDENLVLQNEMIERKIPETSNTDNILQTKEIPKPKVVKANNNNNSAVPFGKWTEAHRQEFLNKIKETKIPSNFSNTKQLKQPNDLNRRDVLKKIDSQRQTAAGSIKINDFGNKSKVTSKVEAPVFVNKSSVSQQVHKQDTKVTALKPNTTFEKQKPIVSKKVLKDEPIKPVPTTKKPQRKEINNQDLIDKTIEDIINRAVTGKISENKEQKPVKVDIDSIKITESLDDIERKMNELHGIPFEERSAKEMSQMIKNDSINTKPKIEIPKPDKGTKIPTLVPLKKEEPHLTKEKNVEEISDEEIIEHEPITGDIDTNKQNLKPLSSSNDKPNEKSNKEGIITENDFDKFARRNSITYENCLTMSLDSKEPHSVMQTIVEKDAPIKKLSRNELMLAESKAKSANKLLIKHHTQTNKLPTAVKSANEDDMFSKNYQSKVQIAYQSVMTKRNSECPITIIEDKPVKVVYMDSNMEYMPMQSNIQGKELSPSIKQASDSSDTIVSASESLDSDVLEIHNEIKSRDESKFKSKHQRKQVFTPVEETEIELIEPGDLGIEVSPKKKRKLDDKNEKIKNLVPKKSYLLNRSPLDEEVPKPALSSNTTNDSKNTTESFKSHTDTISAIDNLVKAAELIENQAEKITKINDSKSSLDNSLNTPKRGRGRPRKYPLPDRVSEVKAPSPHKKPRLIDAKPTKTYSDSDDSSDSELIKENWTMGKINENIVCPICNKLFRSENVVFKHVKHCTGPSPNRSDSDQRSPTRRRHSFDRKSRESTSDFTDDEEEKQMEVRSRKSRHYYTQGQDDVILIEDTPIKEKPQKSKIADAKKNIAKTKVQSTTNNLMCEFCGKTFRQLSYLVNHKLQHKKEEHKNSQSETDKNNFSCEICKKEFRKLHHLVQHRFIHNTTNPVPTRQHRKSSSEQQESKSLRRQSETKQQSDDASAGFRCEPCDKSFRKLHHLVEHRETHDGISKKSTSHIQSSNDASKPSQAYQCDVCKKSYRKLSDFLEHKEQHLETSSEKSDDKSVKSSLSTKDIIHECSLCYMVFPNEHSLNKHTIICLRKKKQSAAKQAAKKTEEVENIDTEEIKLDESVLENVEPNDHCQRINEVDENVKQKEDSDTLQPKQVIVEQYKPETLSAKDTNELNKKRQNSETKPNKKLTTDKGSSEEHKNITPNDGSEKPVKVEEVKVKEYIKIPDTPPTLKKKLPIKEKIGPTLTKRHKPLNVTMPVVDDTKQPVDSSDDDEVRYMLNPNFKNDDSSEVKLFMKVRANKRNSLQIERPNSKDLIKRRISLQHPPKIPRLKVKAVEPRPLNSLAVEKKLKLSKPEPSQNTDSDDSDVKYSFPIQNSSEANDTSKDEKKSKKHPIAAKRKSLTGIAKRKSMGKHKLASPTINKIKKRTIEIGHRCDCGQLFSSAALLSRHTTLAHTPPRIRRRRSPPPEAATLTTKDIPNKTRTNKTKPAVQAKKPKNDVSNSNTNANKGARKSTVNNSEAKVASSSCKIESSSKTIVSEPIGKVLRSAAHRGVPVPDKMRKLMEKSKK